MAEKTVQDDRDLLSSLLAARTRPLYGSEAASFAPPTTPLIRLGAGVPNPAALPVVELEEAARYILQNEGNEALQYGGPQGYLGLREMLADHIGGQEGIELNAANFMLTGGAAQALAAVCFAFLDPGDAVITEDPTFPGSLRAFRAHQAELLGVPFDTEGPIIEAMAAALENAARRGHPVKLIYLTPNSQNPTGLTFSLARRQAIVDLVADYDCLIAEDDAYGELRYDGKWLPSLYTLAGGQGVVRLGTFSKTIGPGLRLGWTQASQELTRVLTSMRLDMGISPLLARVVTKFGTEGRYGRYVQSLISFYGARLEATLALLDEHCSAWARWQPPSGGFFVWLELTSGLESDALAMAAYEDGVSISSGRGFFCQEPSGNYLRLAFSYVAPEELEEAVRRLGKVASRLLGRI